MDMGAAFSTRPSALTSLSQEQFDYVWRKHVDSDEDSDADDDVGEGSFQHMADQLVRCHPQDREKLFEQMCSKNPRNVPARRQMWDDVYQRMGPIP